MEQLFSQAAIGEIDDVTKIRVLIFINNRVVHVPFTELVKQIVADVENLKTRVTDLETP